MREYNLILQLIGRGWLECTVGSDDSNIPTVTMSISYLSDAIYELADRTVAIMNGMDRVTCKMEDEPGEYRWLISSVGDELDIQILFFDEAFSRRRDEAGVILFQITCPLRKFAVQVKNQCECLYHRPGEDGYKELWGHEFPKERLQQLQHLFNS